ncbi:hypothetical protein QT979_16520 [Microcoleus sp. w2-18bC1]
MPCPYYISSSTRQLSTAKSLYRSKTEITSQLEIDSKVQNVSIFYLLPND